jgi:hypothetical protein
MHKNNHWFVKLLICNLCYHFIYRWKHLKECRITTFVFQNFQLAEQHTQVVIPKLTVVSYLFFVLRTINYLQIMPHWCKASSTTTNSAAHIRTLASGRRDLGRTIIDCRRENCCVWSRLPDKPRPWPSNTSCTAAEGNNKINTDYNICSNNILQVHF